MDFIFVTIAVGIIGGRGVARGKGETIVRGVVGLIRIGIV